MLCWKIKYDDDDDDDDDSLSKNLGMTDCIWDGGVVEQDR